VSDDYAHDLNGTDSEAVKIAEKILLPLEMSLRFSVKGIDSIPAQGPGIIVMNHGALPLDALFLAIEFFKKTGRTIRPLVSQNIRKHKLLQESIRRLGGVDANAFNARRLMERGELILLYPGGPQEGLKQDGMQYSLIWKEECGFVKLALTTAAPVIPAVTIGLDDNLAVLGDGRLINNLLFGEDAYLLPIIGPKRLLPKKVTCYVGQPINFDHPPEAATDKNLVMALQGMVKHVMEEMIDRYRQQRSEHE